MVLTCNLLYLWYMYISYLRYPELIFKGRPLLDLEWLWVGYQVRAASNGELEDFKKDLDESYWRAEKKNRKCSDLSLVPSALTWQSTWQWHQCFLEGGWWLKVVRECFNHDVWTTSRRTRKLESCCNRWIWRDEGNLKENGYRNTYGKGTSKMS